MGKITTFCKKENGREKGEKKGEQKEKMLEKDKSGVYTGKEGKGHLIMFWRSQAAGKKYGPEKEEGGKKKKKMEWESTKGQRNKVQPTLKTDKRYRWGCEH